MKSDIPLGKSLKRLQKDFKPIWEYFHGNGHGAEKRCFFCGLGDIYKKDYCKQCYDDFIKSKIK